MADENTVEQERLIELRKSLNPPPRNVYPPKPIPTSPPPAPPKDKK